MIALFRYKIEVLHLTICITLLVHLTSASLRPVPKILNRPRERMPATSTSIRVLRQDVQVQVIQMPPTALETGVQRRRRS